MTFCTKLAIASLSFEAAGHVIQAIRHRPLRLSRFESVVNATIYIALSVCLALGF